MNQKVLFILCYFFCSNLSYGQKNFNQIDLTLSPGVMSTSLTKANSTILVTDASIMEDISGSIGLAGSLTVRVLGNKKIGIKTGIFYSTYEYGHVVSNIRTINNTFDISGTVNKNNIGIPILLSKNFNANKVDKFLSVELGIIPAKTFYRLDNISASQDVSVEDPIFLSGTSLDIADFNLISTVNINFVFNLNKKMTLSFGPYASYNLLADKLYIRYTLAHDFAIGINLQASILTKFRS